MYICFGFSYFFFSSRRRHTRCLSDWSSDVCSSDLGVTGVDLRELVDDEDVGEIVHAGAAQILRPGNTEQSQVGHAPHVVPRERAVAVVLRGARLHDLLREVAHHVADLEMVVGEVERVVHAGNIVARYTLHVTPPRRSWNV